MKISVTINLELSERAVEAITLAKSVSRHLPNPDDVSLEDYIKERLSQKSVGWINDIQYHYAPFFISDLIPDGNGGYKLPPEHTKRF